jgi:ketosteroid isomerase-like protein
VNLAVAGNPVPAALAAYFENLDADRPQAAAAAFSADAVYARPPRDAPEVAPRLVVTGRDAIQQLFSNRGSQPWRHRVLVCVAEGPDCLVEGITETGAGARSTFAATAQLDGAGLVARYVVFQCEPVTDPMPATGTTVPGDAGRIVRRYFDSLAEGNFAAAAACFSEDVVYCHPPYTQGGLKGGGRVWFRSRPELQDAFERRGRTSYRHELPVLIQRGPNCLFEVVTPSEDGALLGSGLSSLSLDADGLISRYVTFFTVEPVPRR